MQPNTGVLVIDPAHRVEEARKEEEYKGEFARKAGEASATCNNSERQIEGGKETSFDLSVGLHCARLRCSWLSAIVRMPAVS